MSWFKFYTFLIFLVPYLVLTTCELDATCSLDKDCKVKNSRCESGICTCMRYHAKLNSTTCLESKLLSYSCMIDAQCTLRVANSTCKDEQCQCRPGFMRFRQHTCLRPAMPGEICYSDEHCRIHRKSSHCEFIIPNLFGKCKCEEENCEINGAVTTKNTEKVEENQYVVTSNGTRKGGVGDVTITTKEPEELTLDFIAEPFPSDKQQSQEFTGDNMGDSPWMDNDLTEEVENGVRGISSSISSNEFNESNYRKESDKGDGNGSWKNIQAISLGYPCQHDLECQKEDTYSRCIQGFCDCAVNSSDAMSCSKGNTGCATDTFQCRSSGKCISWFFVCDGREDCPDGSDEKCLGPECPYLSFQCGKEGRCVSQGAICDGVQNCPDGEDELFCIPQHRNKTSECPRGTFQCSNGRCLPKFEFCNAIPKCEDGSDESLELCRSQHYSSHIGNASYKMKNKYCPFECANGRCRSTAIVCSGRDGCGDNSDEANCTVCRCPKTA